MTGHLMNPVNRQYVEMADLVGHRGLIGIYGRTLADNVFPGIACLEMPDKLSCMDKLFVERYDFRYVMDHTDTATDIPVNITQCHINNNLSWQGRPSYAHSLPASLSAVRSYACSRLQRYRLTHAYR